MGKDNKEIEGEQEYPEEFEPNEKIKDADIKEFLAKKDEREAKKDGKKDTAQESVPEPKKKVPGTVPESVEESQEIEEPEEPVKPDQPKITYTRSFNMPVNHKNIETAKKILVENAENGFVIALQVGTYVDKSNAENVKKALNYFVKNNYKVIITTEQTQEVPDDQ